MESADKNPKLALGAAKPGVHNIPPAALVAIGRVMQEGERKYGPMNWRTEAVPVSVYYDAALRHLLAYWDGQDIDVESGLPHLWLAASNLCILIDAHTSGGVWLDDDRPPVAGFTNVLLSDINETIKDMYRGN